MTEKRYEEVFEFNNEVIRIGCPKCGYPMRVLAKDNDNIYQCYCASCKTDRFMKDTFDVQRMSDEYCKLSEENEELKKELKRCKDWINSDKYDYELTLAFIKNKGYSLKDVLEYEKGLYK